MALCESCATWKAMLQCAYRTLVPGVSHARVLSLLQLLVGISMPMNELYHTINTAMYCLVMRH